MTGEAVDGGTKSACRRPEHGTPRCYQLGCRLPECTAANTRAVKLYRYRTNYGAQPIRVDAAEAHQYLADLFSAGWSGQAIGDRLGVTRKTVHRYRKSKRLAAETVERIADLWGELSKPVPVTAREKQSMTRTLKFAASTGSAPVSRRPQGETLGEYRHFKSFGMTDRKIADRLGVSMDGLQKILSRAA